MESRYGQLSHLSIYAYLLLCLAWASLSGTGCQSSAPNSEQKRTIAVKTETGPVHSIRLLTSPVLFNLDEQPGPDGLKARIYALRNLTPKAVPISEGILEVIIYDGDSNRKQKDTPRQVWSYSGAVLDRQMIQTSIGYGYDFTLIIDKTTPLPSKLSVMARLTQNDGASISAKPVSISIEP